MPWVGMRLGRVAGGLEEGAGSGGRIRGGMDGRMDDALTGLGRYSRQNYLGGQAMRRCVDKVGRYVSAGSLVLLLCRSVPGRAAARVPFETPWGGLAGTSKGPAALAGVASGK